jgi:hypothetical protein
MPANDNQLEMLGRGASRVGSDAQEEVARGCRDRHHALVKCYELSNLTPKQVYGSLGIQQSAFSRIISGTEFPDPNKLFDWMTLCGNIIPVRYDALQVKHELVPMRTDVEEKLRVAEEENADLRRAMKLMGDLMRGKS